MVFEHPLALALLPLAAAPFLAPLRRKRQALPMPAVPDVEQSTWRVKLLWLPRALGAVSIACALLAAAGPHAGERRMPDRRFARDIILAVDASESMRAVDYDLDGAATSRMDVAVRLIGDFIARRDGDRIGLVAFGGRAVTQCPLTFDRRLAEGLLAHVEPEMLGKRTALGDAVALGVARLPRGGAIVLVSDGQNTAGAISPAEAARAAAERGVRVYCVGIGSDGPAPVPARLPSGRVRMEMKDYRLDEAALREMARASGGAYFRAADTGALDRVFASIDELEARPVDAARVVPIGSMASGVGLAAAAALIAALVAASVPLRTAPHLS